MTRRVTTDIADDLHMRMRHACLDRGTTVQVVLRELIADAFPVPEPARTPKAPARRRAASQLEGAPTLDRGSDPPAPPEPAGRC